MYTHIEIAFITRIILVMSLKIKVTTHKWKKNHEKEKKRRKIISEIYQPIIICFHVENEISASMAVDSLQRPVTMAHSFCLLPFHKTLT